MCNRLTTMILATLCGLSMAGEYIVVPHVANDLASFQSQLILENRTDRVLQPDILAYGAAGLVENTSVALEPGARVGYTMNALFPGKTVTHLLVTENPGLFAGMEFTPTNNPANRTFVEGVRTFSERWRVYPSNWQHTFDGLAVVAPSCYPYTVTVTQYDAQGGELARLSPRTINGFEKLTYNLGSVFEEVEGSYVEVHADLPVAAMGLKGALMTDSGMNFLVGNQAEAYPLHEELLVRLAENRLLWATAGFGSTYDMRLQYSCFCPFAQPANLTVDDGALTEITYDDGGAVALGDVAHYPTVVGLFDMIAQVVEQGAERVIVRFHPTYGYPEEILVDWSGCVVDEETVINVLSVADR